eukprot:2641312-Rhodomonas_salina.1
MVHCQADREGEDREAVAASLRDRGQRDPCRGVRGRQVDARLVGVWPRVWALLSALGVGRLSGLARRSGVGQERASGQSAVAGGVRLADQPRAAGWATRVGRTEVDEDHVRVESCTFRSLTAASSVVQHRLALSKDNAYFEVLLLDDPIKGVDAKHKWSVGVAAHERHKADTHVGWMEGSVGYHPKDGTLYDGRLERMHELYDTATVGDVVGCGCIFTDGKEITVKRIFFTKNGALVGSVNCEGWEKLGRPPVASVGLEGEG